MLRSHFSIRKPALILALALLPPALAGCEFEPDITPIAWPTAGPQAFGPAPLDQVPQASPIPIAPSPTPYVPILEPELPLSGGDEFIGYDYIDGSEPPMWRIWFEGKELLISPEDPAAAVLLSSFFSQGDKMAQAMADYESAVQDAGDARTNTWLGGVGFATGGVVALLSCAGVPLTFWALGGTGWTCALGIVGALAGGGSALVSASDRGRAVDDQQDALDRRNAARDEAGSLFGTLDGASAP